MHKGNYRRRAEEEGIEYLKCTRETMEEEGVEYLVDMTDSVMRLTHDCRNQLTLESNKDEEEEEKKKRGGRCRVIRQQSQVRSPRVGPSHRAPRRQTRQRP